MMTRARLQPLVLPAITILIAFAVHVGSSSADGSTVDAVALPGGPSNASDSWKRLLFNQAKYDHRYAAKKQKPLPPQLQQKPSIVGSESAAAFSASDVSFEEQDYRLEDVLMRPGQMIELLGLSNYLPRYMRFERPPQAANNRDTADYKDFDYEEDDDDDKARRRNQPSLEQLLKVQQRQSTGKRLRRRRHRSSRRGRRRRGRQANRDSSSSSSNQLAFLRRPQRRRLRRYLLEATACRVSAGWRDLGKAFWPRWLRQGECRQPPGGSCSIPSGMRCKPASTKRLYVLRYLCARHWLRSQCRWVRQSLPVLQSCECSCS